MEENLPKLTSFILPSGHNIASRIHIARTVCRRAERNLVTLTHSAKINPLYLKYLNRLSDYLFVLARDILYANGINEVLWEKD